MAVSFHQFRQVSSLCDGVLKREAVLQTTWLDQNASVEESELHLLFTFFLNTAVGVSWLIDFTDFHEYRYIFTNA